MSKRAYTNTRGHANKQHHEQAQKPPHGNNRRLTQWRYYAQLSSLGLPAMAQTGLAIVLITQHQWLYACMLLPSIITCLASLLQLSMQHQADATRESARSEQALLAASPTSRQTSPLPWQSEQASQRRALGALAQLPSFDLLQCLQPRDIPADPLLWRSIVHHWLDPPTLRVPLGIAVQSVNADASDTTAIVDADATDAAEQTDAPQAAALALAHGNMRQASQFSQTWQQAAQQQAASPTAPHFSTLYLDLLAAGPHALVAGTTGSGKSVLLQAWCLALAWHNAPSALNFVFLDFKGGTAFQALQDLPHTVGMVCDLDLRHAVRALEALEAEIRRREQLAREHGVAHIMDMSQPPPRLLVVIDEFHALRHQLPDYVDRIVRIASLGRSLGMHVIACTQNPLNQVSAEMKANIALHVCLRVQDAAQSRELLNEPYAAYISGAAPGIAYCNDSNDGLTAFRCAQVASMHAILRHIAYAQRVYADAVPAPLFTQPLPPLVTARMVEQWTASSTSSSAPIQRSHAFGLLDDGIRFHAATLPEHLTNVLIIGRMGCGKTTLLNVLAKLLAHAEVFDDADELFQPMHAEGQALKTALNNPAQHCIVSVASMKFIPQEMFSCKIIFPTGDRTLDAMHGIPSHMLATLTPRDCATPGRAVLLAHGEAHLVQCMQT